MSDSNSELLNPRYHMQHSSFVLKVTGPFKFKSNNIFTKIGISIFKVLNVTIQFSVIVTTALDTLHNMDNIPIISENICYLFPMTTILTKIIFSHFNEQNIKDLTERIHRPIDLLKNSSDPGVLMIIRQAMSYQFFDRFIYTFVCVSVSATTFLLASYKDYELPIRAKLPFNSTVTPNYQIAYAFQAYGIMVNCAWVTNFDILLLSLIRWMTVDSHILQLNYQQCKYWREPRSTLGISKEGLDAIKNYKFSKEVRKDDAISSFIVFEEDQVNVKNDSFYKRFISCLVHHQQMLQNIKDTNELFSVVLFIQTFSNCSLTCMGLFGLVRSIKKRLNPMNNLVMLQIGFINQLYWCTFGHFLIVQHDFLIMGIYKSGWEDQIADQKFLQIFVNTIIFGMKPMVITAGHFFDLSMKTYLSVLNKAYSFFAILNTATTEDDF